MTLRRSLAGASAVRPAFVSGPKLPPTARFAQSRHASLAHCSDGSMHHRTNSPTVATVFVSFSWEPGAFGTSHCHPH